MAADRCCFSFLVTRMIGGTQGCQYRAVWPKKTPGWSQSGNDDWSGVGGQPPGSVDVII